MEERRVFPIFVYFSFILFLGLSLRLVYCNTCLSKSSSYKAVKLPTVQSFALPTAAAQQKMQAAPQATSHFTAQNPASLEPVLRWTKVEGAPAYELEVFAGKEKIVANKSIYTNGYNVSLPENFQGKSIVWHVRGLDLERNPLTPFSADEVSYINKQLPPIKYPVPTNQYNSGKGRTLLYPVYNWVPVNGAAKYEVEVLSEEPENPQGAEPSQYRIGVGSATGFDWYDDEKRVAFRPMYWRVRGVDAKGGPVGIFSPAQKFETNPQKNYVVGTLGDSITHGGGAVSYSPGDWEYSYQNYMKFDSINLGESGDTSASMLARFDADVLPFHLKYLIIMGGSNSLRADVSAEDVISDLENIKNKAEANGIMPVFLTLPAINPANIKRVFDQPTAEDWQEKFAAVNAYIRTQRHIDLATKIPEQGPLPTYLATDGLHLDVPGKKLMAEAINEQWANVIQ